MLFQTYEHAEALLLKAARTHGIQVRKDELQRQLRDDRHAAALAEWAAAYLTADNLLTADELALYSALDESGRVDELSGLHDFADVQPVSEDDLRAAVEELRRSTESIARQSEALRQQHEDLSRFVRTNEDGEARRRDLDAARERKAETERMRVAAEVEAASQSLAYRISDLEEQGAQATSTLSRILDETFRSDDELLSDLQKLGYDLDRPDPEETSKLDKLRDICARLVNVTVDTVKTRLDTIYTEALLAEDRPERAKPATDDDVRSVQAEVEGLYADVLYVAQMSLEHQHLEPALRSVTAASGASTLRTSSALGHINDCLDYLLARLHRLQARMDAHLSHQSAATALISTAQTEMSVGVPPPDKTPPGTNPPAALGPIPGAAGPVPPSPARKTSSPVRLRSNTGGSISRHHRRRSSSISGAAAAAAAAAGSIIIPEELAPLDALAQALALPAGTLLDPHAPRAAKVAAVSRVADGRQRRLDDVARGAQEAFEIAAAAALDDTRRAIQLLRDSLLAESPYGAARLIDPEIVGSLTVLQQEVGKAQELLGLVEAARADRGSDKKEDFLQRWAR